MTGFPATNRAQEQKAPMTGLAWHHRLVCIALTLLAGCAPAPQGDRPPAPLARGTGQTVEIHAAIPWQSTGIYVEAGETYELRAEGKWSLGPTCGTSNADGVGHNTLFCTGTKPVPGHPTATLVGRVGATGQPFVVGSRRTLTAEDSGPLLMGVNADAMYFDNTGFLTVNIDHTGPDGPPATLVADAPAAEKKAAAGIRFSRDPEDLAFPQVPERPDDIAVVIGNADYGKLSSDIPNVVPAYADAEGFKRYALASLGIREGNLIELHDATGAQMERVFGSQRTHKGQLYDWVRPGRSTVWIYYAGHGAPAGQDGSAYLVPADADAARIEINGYPLDLLFANLGKARAKSVTVVMEACFSGTSQAGSVIQKASPVYVTAKALTVPANVTVISAGRARQIASWEEDGSHSLFTKYYLRAMAGEADINTDGTVSHNELERYLDETLTYFARRYYGRDQNAQITVGGD